MLAKVNIVYTYIHHFDTTQCSGVVVVVYATYFTSVHVQMLIMCVTSTVEFKSSFHAVVRNTLCVCTLLYDRCMRCYLCFNVVFVCYCCTQQQRL
jgi:hypothetical protein